MKADQYISIAFSDAIRDLLTEKTVPLVELGLREAMDRLDGRQEKLSYWKPQNARATELQNKTWDVVSGLIGHESGMDSAQIAERSGAKRQTVQKYMQAWVAHGMVKFKVGNDKRYLYYREDGMPSPVFRT